MTIKVSHAFVMLIFICLSVTTAGCGQDVSGAAAAGTSQLSVDLPALSAPPAVTGATPNQKVLIDQVLSHMSSPVASLRVGVGPGCPKDCPDPAHPSGQWLFLTLISPSQAAATKAFWQGLLIVGAIRDLSYGNGLPDILGKTIRVELPDGSVADEGESTIDQPATHPIPNTDEATILAVVSKANLGQSTQADVIEVERPLMSAAVLRVVTGDERSFVEDRATHLFSLVDSLAAHDAPISEGTFVETFASDGTLLSVSGYSVRTGEGVGWINPAAGFPLPPAAGSSQN